MKKTVMAASVSALLAVIGVRSALAEDPPTSKVTGGGWFLDIGADETTGSLESYSFTVNINPNAKAGKNSPQAVVQVDGPGLREFWGGPLVLKDDTDDSKIADIFEPDDPKPGQQFLFVKQHPLDGTVVWVWVFAHDNVTPGYNAEDPGWSDWFGVFIEPVGGDGWPNFFGFGDDYFTAMGIVTQGNIMDHRK